MTHDFTELFKFYGITMWQIANDEQSQRLVIRTIGERPDGLINELTTRIQAFWHVHWEPLNTDSDTWKNLISEF